jgi:hypothetical protein
MANAWMPDYLGELSMGILNNVSARCNVEPGQCAHIWTVGTSDYKIA